MFYVCVSVKDRERDRNRDRKKPTSYLPIALVFKQASDIFTQAKEYLKFPVPIQIIKVQKLKWSLLSQSHTKTKQKSVLVVLYPMILKSHWSLQSFTCKTCVSFREAISILFWWFVEMSRDSCWTVNKQYLQW